MLHGRNCLTLAVVDCSLAMRWCFADEASPAGDEMLDYVRDCGALVPGLWFLEVGNVLFQAEKRHRISPADVAMRLELMSVMPIMVDQNTVGHVWGDVLDLARAEALTVCDAEYLEFALRRFLPFFTLDKALVEAVRCRVVRLDP